MVQYSAKDLAVDIESMPEIPKPCGYTLLIAMPQIKEKTDGGIILPTKLKHAEEVASICGMVISMGDDCYGDPVKFVNGPWCAVGDWVLFRSYSGTRFKMKGVEYRLINDDTVEAVTERPDLIERA